MEDSKHIFFNMYFYNPTNIFTILPYPFTYYHTTMFNFENALFLADVNIFAL